MVSLWAGNSGLLRRRVGARVMGVLRGRRRSLNELYPFAVFLCLQIAARLLFIGGSLRCCI